MNRLWLVVLGLLPAGSGCTTLSLENYTLRQVRTEEDYRSEAALDCLASTAANADALPAFGLAINGTTKVQDMATGMSTTLWTRAVGFASETLAVSVSRQPMGSWSLEPVGDNFKLAAVRCACLWAVYGPEVACRECGSLLEDPAVDYSPLEPRFGVADRLRRLRPGWLHVGGPTEVPACARRKGHCKGTWVWVLPEDECSFEEFVLVLHDIATIDIAAIFSPPLLVTVTRSERTLLDSSSGQPASPPPPPDKLNPLEPPTPPDQDKGTTFQFTEYRVVRPERRAQVEGEIQKAMRNGTKVNLTLQQWLDYTYAYSGTRTNTKASGGILPPGGPGAALQQQNLVPPSRNPALYPQFLGSATLTPAELARFRAAFGNLGLGPAPPTNP
jgi:hypothetical protein